MNIGFDFDNIFIETSPLLPSRLIERCYKQQDNGILLYRIPSRPEQFFRRMLHLPFLRLPIRENIDLLKNSPHKNNKFYLISSRFGFLEKETYRLLKKHQLDKIFDGVYLNVANEQPHLFKEKMIQKLKLDRYIDDDLSLLKYVAKTNATTKFFWLNHAHAKHSLPKNIFEIKNLVEIVQ